MGCCGGSHHKDHQKQNQHEEENAIDILKMRLAKGEITSEEFEKTKGILISNK